MGVDLHSRSILVWDVPDAVECGRSFKLKVGLKCSAGCPAEGWTVEIIDGEGASIASGSIGHQPAAGTESLAFAELEIRAPADTGLYEWKARAAEIETAADDDPKSSQDDADIEAVVVRHAEAVVGFRLRTVAAPECRLTVIAVERSTQSPVRGARVVVHPYRMTTDDTGRAELDLPRGQYRLFVSGRDLIPFRSDGELDSDTTIRAELDPDLGPSDAELWS